MSLDSISGPTFEALWLGVSLNGQQSDDVALFLRNPAGRVLAPAAQLQTWRLQAPGQSVVTYDGGKYVPLDAFPGLTYSIDETKQMLLVNAPADSFEHLTLHASNNTFTSAGTPPPFGGFLNYDLLASEVNSRSALTGQFEASVFGRAGAAVLQYLVRGQADRTQAVRLDTTWTTDHPESASSFRLGDSITGASAWGGAVRFAGVQWASNYATRPGLITMPLPSIAGEAALPSTLSVYVNNALRLQSSLPEGPFRVTDVPVITGEGDVRLVVRDLLGREQIVSEPYYASPELLRPGLQEYSLEAGAVRNNYGLASNDYGRPLIVATDRVGLTERLTTEAHAEILKDQQTVGVSGATAVSTLGVIDASLAGSHGPQGQGQLLGVGFGHSAREFSVGGNIEYASRWFVRIGTLPDQPTPRLTSQIYASVGLVRLGSLSVSCTRETFYPGYSLYQGHSLSILSIRDSVNVGRLGYLSLSVIRTSATMTDTTVALSLTHSLNARTSTSLTTTRDSSGATTELDLQRSLPAGRGIGYRLIADAGATRAADATVDLQSDTGNYELEARTQLGSTMAQVTASGGVAMVAGHLFPGRQIDDSFAVVHVGDQSGVRVYRENQLVGQTDSQGYLLVPGLRAYQDNSIGIEQADLPLDIVVNTVQAKAVPYFRSGVVVDFPLDHARGALVAVNLENGSPLPPAATVRITGQATDFPSGMNGEVYLSGLADHNEISAQWNGGSCHFSMPYTPSDEPLPRLGPYVCRAQAQ